MSMEREGDPTSSGPVPPGTAFEELFQLDLPERGTGARSASRSGAITPPVLDASPVDEVTTDGESELVRDDAPEPVAADADDDAPSIVSAFEAGWAATGPATADAPPTEAVEPVAAEPTIAVVPADEGSGPVSAKRRVSPPPAPSTGRRVAFVAALLVLVFAGLGLVLVGVHVFRDSTKGRVLNPNDDPNAPNFEAVLDPSPTLLLVHKDSAGKAVAFTFLSLGRSDAGGAVICIPIRTKAEIEVFGNLPAELAYEGGGPGPLTDALQRLLTTGIAETVEVTDARWASLVEPVAPVVVDNPDDVFVAGRAGEKVLAFAKGTIKLEAGNVGPYLSTTGIGETDLQRLERHQRFWSAWLAAIASSKRSDAVPGETTTGLGRFAHGLAEGRPLITTLPVSEGKKMGDEVTYDPIDADINDLITRAVPLPTSPSPSIRAHVRLLNGTRDRSVLAKVAPLLVRSGAEITIIGNARSFDEHTTSIVYTDPAFAGRALEMKEALGVGSVTRAERPIESADITVMIASDYAGG